MTNNGLCCDDVGMTWEYIDENESDFFYNEIFCNDSYFKHGINLPNSSIEVIIVDIGANLGLFSLAVNRMILPHQTLKVIAFEPIPPICEVLKRNLSSFSSAHIFEIGLGNNDEDKSYANFTYASSFPGESTRHVVESFERTEILKKSALESSFEEIRDIAIDLTASTDRSVDSKHEIELELQEELGNGQDYAIASQDDDSQDVIVYECQIRSLESVLNENKTLLGDSYIDLMKVDVEGDELEVLKGIGSWWPVILQLVVEVYDVHGRLDEIIHLLKSNGFTDINVDLQCTEVSEDGYIRFTPSELKLYYVYARRA